MKVSEKSIDLSVLFLAPQVLLFFTCFLLFKKIWQRAKVFKLSCKFKTTIGSESKINWIIGSVSEIYWRFPVLFLLTKHVCVWLVCCSRMIWLVGIRNMLKIFPFYFRSPNTSVFDLFVVSLARLEHIGASSFPFIPAPLKVFAFQKLLASLQMRMPVMDGFNGEWRAPETLCHSISIDTWVGWREGELTLFF